MLVDHYLVMDIHKGFHHQVIADPFTSKGSWSTKGAGDSWRGIRRGVFVGVVVLGISLRREDLFQVVILPKWKFEVIWYSNEIEINSAMNIKQVL